MDAADKFLEQCLADGRLTPAEYDEVRPGRESSGCVRPEWKMCEYDPQYTGLERQDCEIYINYPAWTLKEIAAHLGTTVGFVRASLARVRRLLPSLQNDPGGNQGLPSLSHMIPLDAPNHEPDLSTATKF